MTISVLAFIIYLLLALIGGAVAGYFISQFIFKRYLAKNPPVNEKMVRAMLTQMGRKPSEKQVRQVMKSMEQAK